MIRQLSIALMLSSGTAMAQADAATPLSPQDLLRCAQQIQTLRDESNRLLQANEVIDYQRQQINQQTRELAEARADAGETELDSGLSLAQERIEHQSRVIAFNKEVEQMRGEVTAVNALKADYEQRCAGRPYKRSELDKLDAEAQQAMRGGLTGVKVPYLDPNAKPVPGSEQ